MEESLDGWDLIMEGRYEEALKALDQELSGDNPESARCNRALALMNLDRYSEALRDYQALEDGESEHTVVGIGICRWLMGTTESAIEAWESGIGRDYTDETGKGVEPPSLLYYAAVRLSEPALMEKATRLLKKVWTPDLRYMWPGPIPGYLLGEVSEEDFLRNKTFENKTLAARRLCRAYFWCGVVSLREKAEKRALELFRQSIDGRIGVLESEYYLARGEVKQLEKP